jgi:hypothetical protein
MEQLAVALTTLGCRQRKWNKSNILDLTLRGTVNSDG